MKRFVAKALVAWGLALLFMTAGADARASAAKPLRVGSKRFVESYVLAEIVTQLVSGDHAQGLGGTAVTFRALEEGSIDVYPEYTGTLAETVTKTTPDLAVLRAALAPLGLSISEPLGFEDKYALATSHAHAEALRKITDLAVHTELRYGLSHEFAGRSDGWPGLAARYGLHPASLVTLDHALSYEALDKGTLDVVDVYTTDAEIERYHLSVIEDDGHFFPPYQAVLVYRTARAVELAPALQRLTGAIDEKTMQRLNARAEIDGVSFAEVAREWIADATGATVGPAGRRSFGSRLLEAVVQHGPRHVELVGASLALSIAFGVPLGIFAERRRRAGAVVLGLTGVVQTIPSLALFCFFIPLLGIGPVPALAALFLYGLLPIVRNTHAGLSSIPGDLRDAARALGLSSRERLVHVELPLASRTILAGIKTSAVVAVGSATIAAFIGAGGLGEPISTGLSLNDVPTLLTGAVPAAALALLVQGLFALIDRRLVRV